MNRTLSARNAARILIGLFSAMALLHLLILLEIVPWTLVWGGRLETVEQMRLFESIALAVTFFACWLAAMGGDILATPLPFWLLKTLLWAMSIYLLLNTVGNLLAENALERFVFTPLALLMALLFIRLARRP